MKKLHELKADRASKIKEQDAIVQSAKKEDRSLTADESTKFDTFQTELEAIDRSIVDAEKVMAHEKRMASLYGMPVGEPQKEEERAEPFSLIRAINNVIDNNSHDGNEAIQLERGSNELVGMGKEVKRNVITLPGDMLFQDRAQTVTGDTGTKGGKLVASIPQSIMPLLPGLRLQDMGATVLPNLTGDYPLISGDEFTFSYVDETAAVTGTDVVYDGPTLKPKRLSGVVDVSNQWLIQSGPASEGYLRKLIAAGIEAALTRAAISGGGTYGPTGLYDSITTVQTGAAADPTWADVVNLETLINSNNATDKNLQYLFDPAMMGALKTIKKDAGSGIFLIEDNMLNGHKFLASTLVGTLDTGASHPVIYGDFGQMAIGFWSGVQFTVDPYTQAPSGKTRLIFNIYNDVQLANEKAFAIRKNFTV